MTLASLVGLGHALAGVAFVAGLVGMWIVRGAASRAESLATMRLLLRISKPFGVLTSASGISVTVLGLAAAVVSGRPLFGPLQGARVDWLFVSGVLMVPIFAFLVSTYPRFGRRLSDALDAAGDDGQITPGVAAAWADPAYRFARRYELGAVLIVLALMIAKPF